MHEQGELLLHVSRVNCDTHTRYYEEREPLAETIFHDVPEDKLRSAVYKHGVEEYGRCTGKAYMDTRSRGTIHCGYVFVKRETYDDSSDTYLCETWITVERVTRVAKPTEVESVAL